VKHIEDPQLNKDIETMGKDSFRHSGLVAQVIDQCKGECAWDIKVVTRLPDILSMLKEQLEREVTAVKVYTEAKRIAERNKTTGKTGGFLNRLLDKVEAGPVDANEVITTLDRIITDEQRHVRLCEDSIATLTMLENK
jgi:rubrerythrin